MSSILSQLPLSLLKARPVFKTVSQSLLSFYQARCRREKIGLPLHRRNVQELVAIFILSCMLIDTNTRRKAQLLSTFCLGHIISLWLTSRRPNPKSRDRKMHSCISGKNCMAKGREDAYLWSITQSPGRALRGKT